jgi:ketosteroid isomerase-like protein
LVYLIDVGPSTTDECLILRKRSRLLFSSRQTDLLAAAIIDRKRRIMLKQLTNAWLSVLIFATLAPTAAVGQDRGPADGAQEARNRTLVTDAFERWSTGTGDVFSLLADDVVWHITGFDPAVAKTYRSRQSLLDAAATPLRARLSKPLKPTVRKIWTDGDDVLVHWDGAASFNDGTQYRNTYLWIMTIRRQRIVAVTAFLDNAAFAAALAKPTTQAPEKAP